MYIRTSGGLAQGPLAYGLGAWAESTLPAGISGKLYEFVSKNSGSMTAVYVPPAAHGANSLCLLVWIHGDFVCGGEGQNAVDYVKSAQFPLAKQLADSNLPCVLVAPSMNWANNKSGHALGSPKTMNAFLNEVLAEMKGGGWSAPMVSRVILAGHSRAHVVLNELARQGMSDTKLSGDLLHKHLADVWLLDTTFGDASNKDRISTDWLEVARKGVSLHIFYLKDCARQTRTVAELIRDKAAKAKLTNVIVQMNDPHCEMPRDRMPGLLAALGKSLSARGGVSVFRQPIRGSYVSGLGACVVPTSVSVGNLLCTAADLAAISGVVGRAVSAAEVRTAITTAVEEAVRLLLNAARRLSRPRPTPGPGDMLRQHFLDAFGVSPEFVPTWRPTGARWDRGDVVRERLRCAARILSNGSIRYRCWGPLSCRDFADPWGPGDWAGVRAGELRICFGEAFWRAFGQPARKAELASTILHEALHIYFPTIRDTRLRGPFGLAACYERFVLLMNGLDTPDYVLNTCASGLPWGDFPLPRPGGPHIA